MADISAVFGILLFLGIAFPGLLTTIQLLFPATVERARLRLDRTPWLCFFVGGMLAAILVIPIVFLFALGNGITQFMAWALVFSVFAIASIGAAGIAAKMGERLSARSGGSVTPIGAFVRGALALELAAAFPVVGWFIFVPLAIVVSLGATAFALLRWVPRSVSQAIADSTVPNS